MGVLGRCPIATLGLGCLAAATLGCLLAACTGNAAGPPVGPPTFSRLYALSYDGCRDQCNDFVVTLRPSGNSRAHVVFGPFVIYGLSRPYDIAVSADGRWLAFTDPSSRLHLINLRTDRGITLGEGVRPAFSADARYLAFIADFASDSYTTGVAEIYDLSTRTLGPVGPRGLSAQSLEWSHRGDRLAFSAARWPRSPGGDQRFGVATGGNPRRALPLAAPRPGVYSGPAWSWDDRGLIYWRSGNGRVWLMEQPISPRPPQVLTSFRYQCKCAWYDAPVPTAQHVLSDLPALGVKNTFAAVGRGGVAEVRLPGSPSSVAAFAVNPSGHKVAVATSRWDSGRSAFRYGVTLWSDVSLAAKRHGPWLAAFWVTTRHGIPVHRP